MDISDTLAPTSDQLDAVELIGGPRTFVIDHVARNNAEQPINIYLRDFPRPWRPGKTMRRLLAAAWGQDASVYAGRSVTLYFDPDVPFGGDKVGGTRVSHMSHLPGNKPFRVPLLEKRGKSKVYIVKPLPDAPTEPDVDLDTVTDVEALRGMWAAANPVRRKQIEARVAELTTGADQ